MPYPREPTTLGDHLKKRRHELGLRQKDVAAQLGVTQGTILSWETHQTHPAVIYIPRIIAFLGYNPYPEPQTFGERIVAKRRQLGLSRKQTAKLLGMDEGSLAHWEKGQRQPTGKRVGTVVKLLHRN